jgi:hypothetical protein
MRVSIFSATLVWNVSHSKKNWARYDLNVIGLYVKYLLFLPDFIQALTFSTDFRQILKISKFMQIRPVEDELYADGQTDGPDELIVAFPNCAKAPKKERKTSTTHL